MCKNLCARLSQRFVVALTVLSALALQYIHRVSFNLALTEITVPSNIAHEAWDDVCRYNDTQDTTKPVSRHAEFHWTDFDQSLLLGLFYAGYILTHLPGGVLSDRYGPKRVMGYGVLLSAVCSLLTPVSARLHVYALGAVRVLMGIAQGPMFPAQSVFLARWSLPQERCWLNALVNLGPVAGVVLGNSCTGFMLEYFHHWNYLFYLYFVITLIWYVLWMFLAHESAATHPFVSEQERDVIENALASEITKEVGVNLCAPLRSVPVWAMIIAHLGHDWAFYIVLTIMPQYLAKVLLYKVSENGLVSSLPWILMMVVELFGAKLAQMIVAKGWLTKTAQHKWFVFLCNQGPVVCFLAASYAGCARGLVVALFTVAMGFMGLVYSSLRVVNVDLAPNFAGYLMALMNGLGSLCGLLAPVVFDYLTKTHTVAEWRSAFFLSAVFITLTTLVYCIWGTSKMQAWNFPSPDRRTTSQNEEPGADNLEQEQPSRN